MKIANTPAGGRVALSPTEYRVLGSPEVVMVTLRDNGVELTKSDYGVSGANKMYKGGTDAQFPWQTSLGKSKLQRLGHFGTEEIPMVGTIGEGILKGPLPKCNRTMQKRASGATRKKSVSSTPTPTVTDQQALIDQSTADAVEHLNKRKDALGESISFAVTEDGYIEVLQRFGRPARARS